MEFDFELMRKKVVSSTMQNLKEKMIETYNDLKEESDFDDTQKLILASGVAILDSAAKLTEEMLREYHESLMNYLKDKQAP